MRLRRGVKAQPRGEFECRRGKKGSGEMLGEYEELIRKKLQIFLVHAADCVSFGETGGPPQKLYP